MQPTPLGRFDTGAGGGTPVDRGRGTARVLQGRRRWRCGRRRRPAGHRGKEIINARHTILSRQCGLWGRSREVHRGGVNGPRFADRGANVSRLLARATPTPQHGGSGPRQPLRRSRCSSPRAARASRFSRPALIRERAVPPSTPNSMARWNGRRAGTDETPPTTKAPSRAGWSRLTTWPSPHRKASRSWAGSRAPSISVRARW